eukprot:ANDGO_02814.mRNA.1 hypothetical protein
MVLSLKLLVRLPEDSLNVNFGLFLSRVVPYLVRNGKSGAVQVEKVSRPFERYPGVVYQWETLTGACSEPQFVDVAKISPQESYRLFKDMLAEKQVWDVENESVPLAPEEHDKK